MKRSTFFWSCLALFALISVSCEKETFEENQTVNLKAETDQTRNPNNCATIPSGEIVNSQGDPIEVGYDEWGYNYQARMFNGYYCDAYQNAAWCQPYADVALSMKWNDAWISNKDCDGDGLLDRHYGFDTYRGSGAWLTNHQSGTYVDNDGNECNWNYFVKIVAAPVDATLENGNWVNADGTVIGASIWGQFAIVQVVNNDPCAGAQGLEFISPDHGGLAGW